MEPAVGCMLVMISATPEGKKELIGFQVGVRESAKSWRSPMVLWASGRRSARSFPAPDINTAQRALDVFEKKYGAKYSGAVECLTKDRDALLAFYSFPAKRWDHVRTMNPIESVFATVCHRTVRAKGALSRGTAKFMVFKLITAASRTWQRLQGENQLPKVIKGIKFRDGIETSVPTSHSAA